MNLENTVIEIDSIYKQKNYKETENRIYNFLKYINTTEQDVDSRYFWYCYVKLANIERRKDQYQEAINFAEKALKYCIIESERYECYWIMGICYKYLNNTQKALYYFNKCIEFYSRVENIEFLAKVLKCKALLLHDEQLLTDAINLLQERNFSNTSLLNDFQKTLDEMKIYNRDVNLQNNIYNNLHNIISLDTYKALRNKTTI